MTIARSNGTVRLSWAGQETSDVELVRAMPLPLAESALQPWRPVTDDKGNGYLWLGLREPVNLDAMPAWISLCFHRGRLAMVTFGVALPDDELEEDWPTEATSKRQVAFIRNALGRQLKERIRDRGVEYPWGRVYSSFDMRGFMASSGVTYKVP
jgi:hypothetical protein